jgi:hypothetical protein
MAALPSADKTIIPRGSNLQQQKKIKDDPNIQAIEDIVTRL